jgi:predicted MFS family arabinose efflux permease
VNRQWPGSGAAVGLGGIENIVLTCGADDAKSNASGSGARCLDAGFSRTQAGAVIGRLSALRHRRFTLFWAALTLSNSGNWMQVTGQSWVIYKMTGKDPRNLGLLGLSAGAATIVGYVAGGVVADRVARVRLILMTQSLQTLVALVVGTLAWLDLLTPVTIVVANFFSYLFASLDNPARQATYPRLVPPEDLQSAVSIYTSAFIGGSLIGPAIAGALLPIVGVATLYFLNALTFGGMLYVVASLRHLDAETRPAPEGSLLATLLHGPKLVASHSGIAALLFSSASMGFFSRSYPHVLPILCDRAWHAGAETYGLALTIGGGGALLGSAFTAAFGHHFSRWRLLTVSMALLSASVVCLAALPFRTAMLSVFIAGASGSVFWATVSTTLQLWAPEHARGRVMSMNGLVYVVPPALGSVALAELMRSRSPSAVIATAAALGLLAPVLLWATGRLRALPAR